MILQGSKEYLFKQLQQTCFGMQIRDVFCDVERGLVNII